MKGKRNIDREQGLVTDTVIYDEYESSEMNEAYGKENLTNGAILNAREHLNIYATPGEWEVVISHCKIKVNHTYRLTDNFKEDSDVLVESDSLE